MEKKPEEKPTGREGRNEERYTEIQNSKEIISYEDFIAKNIRGTETFGNFWLKFYKGYEPEINAYYQRFMANYPELEKELSEKVEIVAKDKTTNRSVLLHELAPKLYEAYLVLIADQDIKNNYELFG
jgi:hypothetical protein